MSEPAYLMTCTCGNKYIATGNPICNPCRREKKKKRWVELIILRSDRRESKTEKKLTKAA